jgi:hypothetical protein
MFSKGEIHQIIKDVLKNNTIDYDRFVVSDIKNEERRKSYFDIQLHDEHYPYDLKKIAFVSIEFLEGNKSLKILEITDWAKNYRSFIIKPKRVGDFKAFSKLEDFNMYEYNRTTFDTITIESKERGEEMIRDYISKILSHLK